MNKINDKMNMIGVVPAYNADPIPVGKIPDEGTQVTKSGAATNTTTILHTVTAGKTFYMVAWVWTGYNGSGAASFALMAVRDELDVIQYNFFVPVIPNGAYLITTQSYPTPIEVPAGYDIVIASVGAGFGTNGFVFGYEM